MPVHWFVRTLNHARVAEDLFFLPVGFPAIFGTVGSLVVVVVGGVEPRKPLIPFVAAVQKQTAAITSTTRCDSSGNNPRQQGKGCNRYCCYEFHK